MTTKAEQLARRLTEHDDPELYEAADLLMFEAAAFIHKQDAAIKTAFDALWACDDGSRKTFEAIKLLKEVMK